MQLPPVAKMTAAGSPKRTTASSSSWQHLKLLLGAAFLATTAALLSCSFNDDAVRKGRRVTLSVPEQLSFSVAAGDAANPPAVTGRRTADTCPTSHDIEQSPWSQSCTLLRKVCVDQGTLVLYEDRFQPGSNISLEPPEFAAGGGYGQSAIFYRSGEGKWGYILPTIRSRPAITTEGTPYLRNPSFSCKTVPIVWYPFWMTNFGHYLRDNVAKLYGVVEDTPWRDNIKFVQVTADGQALPAFNLQLLQPLSALKVETWADFTARLPPGSAVHFEPGPPPSTEGDYQRCFQHMFVCNHGLNITRWPLHEYGRSLVQAYSDMLPPEVQAVAATDSAIRTPQPQQQSHSQQQPHSRKAGASDVGSSGSGGEATTELQVVFQRRDGPSRQLLNAGELLRRCNSWSYRTQAGRQLRTKCWEVDITDLSSGLAAAQQADVMVGIHGANLANGWLMRPGASMIEVQPYGFDQHYPHLQDPLFNAEDKESQVLWWVLMGCDPLAWRPSPDEAARLGLASNWVKNRNTELPWEALETALRAVAEAGGSMERYWELWKSGEWWWHVHGAGNITHGGHIRSICSAPLNL